MKQELDFLTLEQLPNGVIVYSTGDSARLLYANQAALKIFECKDLEDMKNACGDNYLNFFHPVDYQHHIPTIRLAWEKENEFDHHVQYRIITKNNTVRLLDDCGKVIPYPGEQKCYVCVLTVMDREINYATDATDPLTGFLGMGQFVQYSENFLHTAANQSEECKYFIAYFNIRHFKNFNVEYGSQKGDMVLKNLAAILLTWSSTKVITRIGGDQFVAISVCTEESKERIYRVIDEFVFEYGKNGLSLDVGIYPVNDSEQDIHTACDLAKSACDSVKNSSESIGVWSEALSQKLRLSSYITGSLDEALEKEYLKIDYQPILRTLTGAICGIEAFVSWEDPERGRMMPDEFLPFLEESHQSIKLDLWVLNKICERLDNREKKGKYLVPVSINFSYLDFLDVTLFEKVDQIVTEHSIPRDMLRFEIKESLVAGDAERFQKMVQRFRDGGYQIWWDDFGQNFSTTNHLKMSGADAVKVDMRAFQPLTENLEAILLSIIRLSKRLRMQSIAECVETAEQYEFLKKIGCTKLQGNYFCVPGSRETIEAYAEQNDIAMEYRTDRRYYDEVSCVDIVSEHPMAIVEYDQKNFRMLYLNKEFVQEGVDLGSENRALMRYMMNDPSATLSRKFRYLQEHTKLGSEYAEMEFSIFGKYFRIKSRRVSENFPKVANQVEVINLSKNDATNKARRLDSIFRMMYSMYDMIFLLRDDGKFENIMRSPLDGESDLEDLEKKEIVVSKEKVLEHIYRGEREEYAAFTDPVGLKERLRKTERGYETRYFRSLNEQNGLVWKSHTLQYIPEEDMVLLSTRPVSLLQTDLIEKIAPEFLADNSRFPEMLLGKNIKESSAIAMFWKDRDRRFLGANRRYLEMFGLDSESELIGKKVEEFEWFVNEANIKNDEEHVIENGQSLSNVVEKCVVDGETHTVLVSKEPLYKNGKIIGLTGSVVDIDRFLEENLSNENTRDWLTGLLSPSGMLNIVSEYVEGWNVRKENFAVLRIEFLEQKQNYKEYGLDIANRIARKVAEVLKKVCNNRAVIARLFAGNYSLLLKSRDVGSVNRLIQEIKENLGQIHDVEGYDVTFYPAFKVYWAADAEQSSDLIAVATGGSKEDLVVRRQLEDRLNHYNIQLETVVDAIPGGIAMYEVAGKEMHLVYASSGVGAVSGKTPEEFRLESETIDRSNIHPQDVEMLRKATLKAVEDNEEVDVTYRLIRTDRRTIWVNMRGRVVGQQNGHPMLLVVFRDMSESSVIYESIIDEALAGVIVSAHSDGEILYANKSACEVSENSSYGSLEKLFSVIREMCTPQKRTGYGQNNGERRQYEIELANRNLLVYFVDGLWNGRSACICYISDITAKYIEEREKASRESLLYLQAINSSYDLLVTFNLTTDRYTMKQGLNFLGFDWSAYESYSQLLSEVKPLVPEEEQQLLSYLSPEKQIMAYKNGIYFVDNEHRVYDSEGNVHWIADRVVYATDPSTGDVLGISLSMLIDERVKARNEQKEALQRALDDAMEANRSKTEFLSNMSHDIRTPMNAVMGYTAIAIDHLADAEKVKECLERILISGHHLEELINDVLDMSRIESGKEHLNHTQGTWRDFVPDMEAIAIPLARSKNIDLTFDLSGIQHYDVYGDVPKIRRSVINVVGNALKFTGENGWIRCKVSEVPSQKEGFGTYTIEVSDNGIGMNEEYLEHIFEAFSREKNSTESKESGTGLGMAITKRYIELMGGEVIVESVEGQGTTVTMHLDLERQQGAETENVDTQKLGEVSLVGKRVLVVDDSDLNRDIVCMMLEDKGLETEIAVNGREAVDLLMSSEDGAFDYVLMDMRMPVLGGVEAAKEIRASEREYLKKVPILAVSANAFQEDVNRCLEAGMDAHISKPFTLEKLLAKLAETAGRV